MKHIWDKKSSETDKAYAAFCDWLSLPSHKRTFAEMAREKGWTQRTIRHWHGKHKWSPRTTAWEQTKLDEAMSTRDIEREKYRQRLIDEVWSAIDVLIEVMEDADATPSTRLAAATHVLDRAGIVIPKRVELTGADGRELFRRAAGAMDQLSDDQLAALASTFPTDDES